METNLQSGLDIMETFLQWSGIQQIGCHVLSAFAMAIIQQEVDNPTNNDETKLNTATMKQNRLVDFSHKSIPVILSAMKKHPTNQR